MIFSLARGTKANYAYHRVLKCRHEPWSASGALDIRQRWGHSIGIGGTPTRSPRFEFAAGSVGWVRRAGPVPRGGEVSAAHADTPPVILATEDGS